MDPVKAYLSEIGRRGGSKLTPKKLAALKKNAKRPRPGARKSQLNSVDGKQVADSREKSD